MVNQITDLKLLYETDYLQWLENTIKLLNNRQLENLDYKNLIAETVKNDWLPTYRKFMMKFG